jgi:hypothetical protein
VSLFPWTGNLTRFFAFRRFAPPRACYAVTWGVPQSAAKCLLPPSERGVASVPVAPTLKKHLAAFRCTRAAPPRQVGCWGTLKSRPSVGGSTFPYLGSPASPVQELAEARPGRSGSPCRANRVPLGTTKIYCIKKG